MKTVQEIVTLSTEYLKVRNVLNPQRQAEELVSEALGLGRLSLYLEYDRPLEDTELGRCREWLRRRGKGEPIQYIKGVVDFFGCKIKVTADVLIPRQETEILVEQISNVLKKSQLENKVLWDVCCGSGCIGIALKKQFPQLDVSIADISEKALIVAKQNATANEVDVACFQGDLLEPFQGKKADFIVCNPPYIPEKGFASLEREVRDFEPIVALVSGKSGLEFYQRLATQLPHVLNPRGKAWFEIGDGQGEALKKTFQAPCWRECQVGHDWSSRERFFSLEIE